MGIGIEEGNLLTTTKGRHLQRRPHNQQQVHDFHISAKIQLYSLLEQRGEVILKEHNAVLDPPNTALRAEWRPSTATPQLGSNGLPAVKQEAVVAVVTLGPVEGAMGLHQLVNGHPSGPVKAINVLGVHPPQNPMVLEQPDEVMCGGWPDVLVKDSL